MSIFWKNKYLNMKEPMPILTVIIAAAGSGVRMGSVSKPLMTLCGKKAFLYSLEAFDKSPYVDKIIISAKKEDFAEISSLAKDFGVTKLKTLCEGGKTRQESVENAFLKIFAKKEDITPFIAVHDAARPLITTEKINEAMQCAIKHGSAVCAARVRDTMKRTNAMGYITEAVERNELWQIQTPQIFDTDIFHTAISLARKNGTSDTDESSLVSGVGFKVKLFECSPENIKLTYPEDIYLAEMILKHRKDKD